MNIRKMKMAEKKIIKEFKTKEDFVGIITLINRESESWYCGYLLLPHNHKVVKAIAAKNIRGELELRLDYFEVDSSVHGGITFGDTYLNFIETITGAVKNEEFKSFAVYGFDCNHYGDNKEICNEKYVENELRGLSERLGKGGVR